MRSIAEALSHNGLPLDIGGRIFDFLPLGEASRNRSINRYFQKAGDLAIVSKLVRTGIRKRSAREMLVDAVQYRTEAEEMRKKLKFRLLGLGTRSTLSTRFFKFLPLAKTIRHLGPYLKTGLTGCVDIEKLTYRPIMINPATINGRHLRRAVGVNLTLIGLEYEVPVAQLKTEVQLLRDAFRPEDYPQTVYESFRMALDSLITTAQNKQAARESFMNVTFVPILSFLPSQEGTLYQTLKDDLAEPLLERYGTYLSGIGGTKGPSIALDLRQSRFSVPLTTSRYEDFTEFGLDTIDQHLAEEDRRLREGL